MALIDRFREQRNVLDLVRSHRLVAGHSGLAEETCKAGELVAFAPGERLIEQCGEDRDVYMILAGTCDVVINGRKVAVRGPGEHVGEMAALHPAQLRSASVIAKDELVALKLTEPQLEDLGQRHPQIYRTVAQELARRLLQRNAHIGEYRDRIHVFIISSREAIRIAERIQEALERDFLVEIWTNDVFKIAGYTLDSLEEKVDQADFAIAIAHADDITTTRGEDWPAPRDNVIFELGLFMGRLGRKRAILMEPRDEKVRLPSDFAGMTTVGYVWEPGRDEAALLGPACSKLRRHILDLGPNNG